MLKIYERFYGLCWHFCCKCVVNRMFLFNKIDTIFTPQRADLRGDFIRTTGIYRLPVRTLQHIRPVRFRSRYHTAMTSKLHLQADTVLRFLVAIFCRIIRWSIVVHLDCVNRLSGTCITIVVIIPVASGNIRQPPSANHMDSVFYGAFVYLNSYIRDALTLNPGKICEIPYKRQD